MKDRIATEDALKHCHECEYQGRAATAASLAGAIDMPLADASDLLARLEARGLVQAGDRGTYELTGAGQAYARRVVRAHRLYETDLARHSGFPEADWHPIAEKEEHRLSDQDVDRLSRRLGHPRWDPHGDPIPTPAGELPALHGRELGMCEVGCVGRIVHIEDEPAEVYQRVIRLGLVAGMRFRLDAVDAVHSRITADGRTLTLDRPMGALLRVVELPEGESLDEALHRLSDLGESQVATVVGLGPGCRGAERNRLLDLGVVPGSRISIDLVSPSGNPTAYRIRGASIALRREQADHVYVHIAVEVDA